MEEGKKKPKFISVYSVPHLVLMILNKKCHCFLYQKGNNKNNVLHLLKLRKYMWE